MAFNLDTNILLQGRGADIAGSIGRGLEARSMFDQLQMQREQAPIRQQLLESQLAEAQQVQQQNQELLAQQNQNRVIDSIANTYSGVKSLVDTGKFNDAADALEANKEVLRQSGITNFDDSDLAIQALRSGDAKAIRQIQLQGEQAIQMSEARRGAESSERFSPTTTALPGGISIQTTSTGRKVVTDAGGNVLTGQAATDAITAAEEAETQRTIDVTEGKERAKLGVQKELLPSIKSDVKIAEKEAQSRGESLSELASAKAAMPGLRTVVSNLKALSGDATFTLAGKGFNAVAKELGFSTKGDTARSAMIAMVDNQVLPLLKPIFGAAFTAAEGDRLRNAFLDPDSTPDSRVASLDAFLAQMERNIESKERESGAISDPSGADTGITEDQFRAMSPEQRAEVIRQLQRGQ